MFSLDNIKIHKDHSDYFLNEINQLKSRIYGSSAGLIDINSEYFKSNIKTVFLLEFNSTIIGSAILFYNADIQIFNQSTYLLGAFEIQSDYKSLAPYFIRNIENEALILGAKYILGPLNGSTWFDYRFKIKSEALNFPGDLNHSDFYSQLWLENNFKIFNTYTSQIQFDINPERLDLNYTKSIFNEKIIIKNKDIELEEALKLIYPLLMNSFKGKEFFSSISLRDFIRLNLRLESFIKDEYFLMAIDENSNECVGFLMAYPNLFDLNQKGLVIKTLARKNSLKWAGLGYLLSERILEIAQSKNFDYLIHAHMSSNKSSIKLSKNYNAQSLNTYHLFYKSL